MLFLASRSNEEVSTCRDDGDSSWSEKAQFILEVCYYVLCVLADHFLEGFSVSSSDEVGSR